MDNSERRYDSNHKLLFTPGPLTTSAGVKRAMLRDVGSRDQQFIEIIADVRRRLLALANVNQEQGYEAVIVQGSGTFGVEAVISSAVPDGGRLLVLVNGAYGERIAAMAKRHGLDVVAMTWSESEAVVPGSVDQRLNDDPAITHVAAIHCETTTGLINPVNDIARCVAKHGRAFILDSMSAFGAVALDLSKVCVDFVIASSNKCIEGVPGFSFVICKREALASCKGNARTLSLDLYDQWAGLERNGQFRFTPPTHVLLAFHRALIELDEEGGVKARAARYDENHQTLVKGMRRLGLQTYLASDVQGCIITSFHYPKDERFEFDVFYQQLAKRGFVIYPGKVSDADCFRIGHIGQLHRRDIEALVTAVGEILTEMGVETGANR